MALKDLENVVSTEVLVSRKVMTALEAARKALREES
jgi:hypothetical protein